MLARHIARFIPGRPAAVVNNMTGAGAHMVPSVEQNSTQELLLMDERSRSEGRDTIIKARRPERIRAKRADHGV